MVYSTAVVSLRRDFRHLQDLPWLLWPVLVIQRPSQCESIGNLSLVAPTSTLIKSVFPVLLSPVCVCGSVGRSSSTLCSSLSTLLAEPCGARSVLFLQLAPNVGLEPTTLRLRVSCSTDWASRARSVLFLHFISQLLASFCYTSACPLFFILCSVIVAEKKKKKLFSASTRTWAKMYNSSHLHFPSDVFFGQCVWLQRALFFVLKGSGRSWK